MGISTMQYRARIGCYSGHLKSRDCSYKQTHPWMDLLPFSRYRQTPDFGSLRNMYECMLCEVSESRALSLGSVIFFVFASLLMVNICIGLFTFVGVSQSATSVQMIFNAHRSNRESVSLLCNLISVLFIRVTISSCWKYSKNIAKLFRPARIDVIDSLILAQ